MSLVIEKKKMVMVLLAVIKRGLAKAMKTITMSIQK
jgi:hypothetical protein